MIQKIFLDMDGVLTDFEVRWAEVFGFPAQTVRKRKNFSEEWPQFVAQKQFETLDWFPGGQELLQYIQSKNIPTEILSSSGGVQFHKEVKAQKKLWLKERGITYKANVVPGKRKKAEYAKPFYVLIDDTPENVDRFIDHGGIGILHKEANITIEKLESLLNR